MALKLIVCKFCSSQARTGFLHHPRPNVFYNNVFLLKISSPLRSFKLLGIQQNERHFHHHKTLTQISPWFGFARPYSNLMGSDCEHDISKLYRTKILYKNILESFPKGIQMAFAYGSGAVQQEETKDMSKNVLDFIFVVDDPQRWHQENLERHSHHYSFLRHFGAHGLAMIQDRYGGGTYFNTLVPMHGRTIKYGVISTQKLVVDLLDWESLYISGRLHKPVNLVTVPKDPSLIEALIENLQSAVHTALLLLPDVFTEEQLYFTIAGLSYSGDIRMGLAEDNNKVRNIVKPNMQYFQRMYMPIIEKFEHVVQWQETGQIEQALTFDSRHYHLTHLPSQVLQGLVNQKFQGDAFPDLEEAIRLHAYDKACGAHVFQSVSQIVKRSSTSQTMKGVFMAGVSKSVRYGFNKVMKKVKSVKKSK